MTRRLRNAALAFVLALASAVLVLTVVSRPTPAEAFTGADFRPGRIMSDELFYNANTMSTTDIQNFLNAKFQGCASGYVCLRDYTAQTAVATAEPGLCNGYPVAAVQNVATIVWNVAQSCGINPQVLLVLMQKEQSLVTTTKPTQWNYDHATGNNCPDTTGCSAGSSGFFKQVYGAARQFKLYRKYPNDYNYVAGRDNFVLYNPNTNCGGSRIYIENQATAGLYIYTPYQPNAAALANLSGTGDSCSSYGNRNFWRFYNDWFGPIPGPPVDPSVPAYGQVTLASGDVLAAYRVSAGRVVGTSQAAPGGSFGPTVVIGGTPAEFVGQPVAFRAANSTLVVYARTRAGQILGAGQPAVGAAFYGWQTIGTGAPPLVSDPSVIVTRSGAIAMYATASDGNVWGTSQAVSGGSFSRWIRLSASGGFISRPAALVTSGGVIVLYARTGNTIYGSGQSVPGGGFSPWLPMGSATPRMTGDPTVVQGTDGTLAIYAVGVLGTGTSVWEVDQDYPGNPFGTWRPISSVAQFTGQPAVLVLKSGAVVVYAISGGSLQGAQAKVPRGVYTAFGPMGAKGPVLAGRPFVGYGGNGGLGLFAPVADGTVWGTEQSAPGTIFSEWAAVG